MTPATNVIDIYHAFQKPYPFTPDVVEQKVDMLHAHESQLYRWLPYNGGYLDQVPAAPDQRRAWLLQHLDARLRRDADPFRDQLIVRYGEEPGRRIRYAKAFEWCEYGAPMTEAAVARLFPLGVTQLEA